MCMILHPKVIRSLVGLVLAIVLLGVLVVLPETARTREFKVQPLITGPARVIDGDTLDFSGQRVRLEGIDAPEISQLCDTNQGGKWPAGRLAAAHLARIVGARTVTCEILGHDLYGRILGRCKADGAPINARLVREGAARAFVKYSQIYVGDEAAARAERAGIWAHACSAPWAYRAARWTESASAAPEGCAIKGNISRAGRIYHMPWSHWYTRVAIDPSRGERWFCDEQQAQAAGWRPAGSR